MTGAGGPTAPDGCELWMAQEPWQEPGPAPSPARVSAAAQGRPSLAEPGPRASRSMQGAAFTLI